MLLVKVFSTTLPSVSMSKMADTEAFEEIGLPAITRIFEYVSMEEEEKEETSK